MKLKHPHEKPDIYPKENWKEKLIRCNPPPTPSILHAENYVSVVAHSATVPRLSLIFMWPPLRYYSTTSDDGIQRYSRTVKHTRFSDNTSAVVTKMSLKRL